MGSHPLARGPYHSVAAGEHRLGFGVLVDKVGHLMGTPDEFIATDAVQTYIDTQRGRSAEAQAEQFVLRATIGAIDFTDIQPSAGEGSHNG